MASNDITIKMGADNSALLTGLAQATAAVAGAQGKMADAAHRATMDSARKAEREQMAILKSALAAQEAAQIAHADFVTGLQHDMAMKSAKIRGQAIMEENQAQERALAERLAAANAAAEKEAAMLTRVRNAQREGRYRREFNANRANEFDFGDGPPGRGMNSTNANRQQSRQGGNAAYLTMQAAQTLDDLQYGIRGVVNNIPMLLQSMGMGLGLAGVLSIVAVVINQVVQSWDKLSGSMKGVQENAVLTERALENSKNRVVEAHRAIEAESRRQEEANRLLAQSLKHTGQAFEDEASAIKNGLDDKEKMLALTDELAKAEHEYNLAKIAVNGGTEGEQLRAQQEEDASFQKANAERQMQMLDEKIKAAQEELALEKNISDEAQKRDSDRIIAENEIASLKDEIAKGEKNADAEKNRAMAIYQQMLNKYPGSERKFDTKGKTAADFLDEAQAIQMEGFDKAVGANSADAGWLASAQEFWMSLLDQASQVEGSALSRGSLGIDAGGGINIAAITAQEREAAIRIEAAKAELKAAEEKKSALGSTDDDLRKNQQKTEELKRQLANMEKQKVEMDKRLKIEQATLELQQQKAREDMMKSAIAAAMKDASPIVDSITKIGGGGFIGSPESISPMEKALREYKKQVTELEKSNRLLQQIRDKYPSFQP